MEPAGAGEGGDVPKKKGLEAGLGFSQPEPGAFPPVWMGFESPGGKICLQVSDPGRFSPYPSLAEGWIGAGWAGRPHSPLTFRAACPVGCGLCRTSFQRVLVPSGSFASTLPTYQQSEVMVFIMNKVPLPSSQQSIEAGKAG